MASKIQTSGSSVAHKWDREVQLRQLVESLGLDSASPLYHKAQRIIDEIVGIWRRNQGTFHRSDATEIQRIVERELSPDDFRQIAVLSFANWATPARLAGPGLPHLNRINKSVGEQIARISSSHPARAEVSILDLGAGLLSTTEHVARALDQSNVPVRVLAVDSTPFLVQAARQKAQELGDLFAGLRLDLHEGDMLRFARALPSAAFDFVTISFAIHHLHPTEQAELTREVFRLLRAGGAFLVADPQEGKSDFNLNVLIYEEPEAIFASFTSPESMRRMMSDAGFTSIAVLMRDDAGYEGYAICGRKPARRAATSKSGAARAVSSRKPGGATQL